MSFKDLIVHENVENNVFIIYLFLEIFCVFWLLRRCKHLTDFDVESLSLLGSLGYTTRWVLVQLVRYATTKRLNEHLRSPRQSGINRTWLILSRKIRAGKPLLPPPPLTLIFFRNVHGNTYDHRHGISQFGFLLKDWRKVSVL